MASHQDNFVTALTSDVLAGATTSPLNSIPTVDAPFYIAWDATNKNGHYEVRSCTSKTATNVNHSALTYAHTTDEVVRMVVPAVELDGFADGWQVLPTTLAYSSADAPTFVAATGVDMTSRISVGMKIKLTQTTVKYFIVTAIDATTITLYGGTDYTLANAAITLPYFSIQKVPFGFPLNPVKWTVEIKDESVNEQANPTGGTWYNLDSVSISIPIGLWNVMYQCCAYVVGASGTATNEIRMTLSTANNSQSDNDFSSVQFITTLNTGLTPVVLGSLTRSKPLLLASKTVYYLNAMTGVSGTTSITINGLTTNGSTIIRAVCTYL